MRDDAVITFTDTFYRVLFENKERICDAFKQAQLSVEISYSKQEANIFKLLLKEDAKDEASRASAVNDSSSAFGANQNQTLRSSVSAAARDRRPHRCNAFMEEWREGNYNLVSHQNIQF